MKAIIIDDEYLARQMIANLLVKYFPNIQLLGQYQDGISGIEAIRNFNPDIVFLDIKMPGLNGFEVLDSFSHSNLNFKVIFTTSYDEYAIKAIKYSAFDYLLKPINEKEFNNCINRLEKHQISKNQLSQLQENLTQKQLINRITIGHTNGKSFVNVEDIIMMTSDNNYTIIHVKNESPIIASKTLGYFVSLLSEHGHFVRCHKQYLINMKCVKEYIGGDINKITLQEGLFASVSRSQKQKFFSSFAVKK